MATCDCTPLTFVNTCENAFYFKGEEVTTTTTDTDLEIDAFEISTTCPKEYLIRSKDNKILFYDGEFQARNLAEPDCKFKIQTYKEIPGGREGRAAMLYVKVNGKNMVVCCCENHDIYPKEMEDLPSKINETTDPAVFYMIKEPLHSCTFEFESSKYRGEFLGFEPDKEEPSMNKLVLLPKGPHDVVDKSKVTVKEVK